MLVSSRLASGLTGQVVRRCEMQHRGGTRAAEELEAEARSDRELLTMCQKLIMIRHRYKREKII